MKIVELNIRPISNTIPPNRFIKDDEARARAINAFNYNNPDIKIEVKPKSSKRKNK